MEKNLIPLLKLQKATNSSRVAAEEKAVALYFSFSPLPHPPSSRGSFFWPTFFSRLPLLWPDPLCRWPGPSYFLSVLFHHVFLLLLLSLLFPYALSLSFLTPPPAVLHGLCMQGKLKRAREQHSLIFEYLLLFLTFRFQILPRLRKYFNFFSIKLIFDSILIFQTM